MMKMEEVTSKLKPRFDLEKMYAAYRKFLKGAEHGKVVTRFPPEPSGYLHIGHVKAACLNYHYAKMFEGKMIMRFDDTNPAKEKDEYKESILEDLKTLEIYPDQFTHTSDYFDLIIAKCTWSIQNNLAYCDNTDADTMKKERNEGIESKCRSYSVEQNLEIWNKMLLGDLKEYCVRAKMDMQCKNKCMRDPVIFRHCAEPHQVTGTKYKVYPTYDFACPIVDAVEGVTHAMRTNEYADRNHQYAWFIKNLQLRPVVIHDYSRLNFVSTTLSKRKLTWFVEQGLVDGWSDPRFPTVRGIIRHGMLVQTLIEFMLEQGPSKNSNLMEWDKIWALNRKSIDPIALKYTAISAKNAVPIVIENHTEIDTSVIMVPLHPKNEEIGKKPIHRPQSLLVEREDLEDLKVGDRVVLVKWGVFVITELNLSQESPIIKVVHDAKDTDFKNPKKITWLPNDPALLYNVNVLEYDHLLNSLKPDEEKDFEAVVNKNSMFSTPFLSEGHLRTLPVGSHIQFERRGYFIIDKKRIIDNIQEEADCIFIPDGKSKSMSGLSTNIDAKKLAKGNK